MDNKIVYSYRTFNVPAGIVRSCKKGGVARVAFRIERPAKDYYGNKYLYKISFAFASPVDNFSRRAARSLTDYRAFMASDSNDPHVYKYVCTFESQEKKSIGYIIDEILDQMLEGERECPHWLRYATIKKEV